VLAKVQERDVAGEKFIKYTDQFAVSLLRGLLPMIKRQQVSKDFAKGLLLLLHRKWLASPTKGA
jgi:hypothetical protein